MTGEHLASLLQKEFSLQIKSIQKFLMASRNQKGSAAMFCGVTAPTRSPLCQSIFSISAILFVILGLILHSFYTTVSHLGLTMGGRAELPAHQRNKISKQTTIHTYLKSVEGSQVEEENMQTPHREAPWPWIQTQKLFALR